MGFKSRPVFLNPLNLIRHRHWTMTMRDSPLAHCKTQHTPLRKPPEAKSRAYTFSALRSSIFLSLTSGSAVLLETGLGTMRDSKTVGNRGSGDQDSGTSVWRGVLSENLEIRMRGFPNPRFPESAVSQIGTFQFSKSAVSESALSNFPNHVFPVVRCWPWSMVGFSRQFRSSGTCQNPKGRAEP